MNFCILRQSPTTRHFRLVHRRSCSSTPSATDPNKSKYVLAMFPYPSGRLHMGHLRVYTLSDVLARYYSLRGHRVIHPIGWDAFGLPAENAAREHGVDPAEWTYKNIEEMRAQLLKTGVRFDWEREVFTCRPEYFRWTQWLFLQLHKHGLVRKTLAEVNWDPVDGTVLADEQVWKDPINSPGPKADKVDANGCSWRSGAPVEKRRLRHWAVDTPRYAKRMLDGLKALEFDWRGVAGIQAEWIGTCDVYRFLLPVKYHSPPAEESPTDGWLDDERLDLRIGDPAQLCSAQFVLLLPSHPIAKVANRRNGFNLNDDGHRDYDVLDCSVLNFVTGKQMRLVALCEEPKQPKLPFHMDARLGNARTDVEIGADLLGGIGRKQREGTGPSAAEVLSLAESSGFGGYLTSRTHRDWIVSRQRAWGTPIPMLLDEERRNGAEGIAPVAEHQLPVLGEQRGTRVQTDSFPSGWGRLESDTLDTYFDSSWYFLRYLDPRNEREPFSAQLAHRDMPVDVYVGGVEHAKIHLFFARFIAHFLHSVGLLAHPEPFRRFIPLGVVCSPTYQLTASGRYVPDSEVDGDKLKQNAKLVHRPSGELVHRSFEKMSKSKHNGVDPQTLIDAYGADLTRLQLLVESRPSLPINWPYPYPTFQMKAMRRWLNRVDWVVGTYIGERQNQGSAASSARPSAESVAEVDEECAYIYDTYVNAVTCYLEVLLFHNMSLLKLSGMTKSLKSLMEPTPRLCGTSAEFERCVHAIVIMLQAFAPETAAKHWEQLQQLASPHLSSQPFWRIDAPLGEQPWPPFDQHGEVDFMLVFSGLIHTKRVPRSEVEDLDTEGLERYARERCHARFFELLNEHKLPIKASQIERMPGLCIAYHLEMDESVPKRGLTLITQQIGREKAKALIDAARREQHSATGSAEN